MTGEISLGVIPAGSTILRRAEMQESLDDLRAGNPMRMLLVSMPDGACYWIRADGSRELVKHEVASLNVGEKRKRDDLRLRPIPARYYVPSICEQCSKTFNGATVHPPGPIYCHICGKPMPVTQPMNKRARRHWREHGLIP